MRHAALNRFGEQVSKLCVGQAAQAVLFAAKRVLLPAERTCCHRAIDRRP